jgi:SAM-dependent methyltransferase
VIGGVPILIDEDRSVFSVRRLAERTPASIAELGLSKSRVAKLLPTISRNGSARRNYSQLRSLLLRRPSPTVLVIGSGGGGIGFECLEDPVITIVRTDVAFVPGVDALVDAHQIPFEDQTFDAVVLQAVLEYVLNPQLVVGEVCRALKEDGFVYAETPFMQQVHGAEFDFTRFTALGHRLLFRQFAEVDRGITCGPGTALAWAWEYLLLSFARSRNQRRVAMALARVSGFWCKHLDRLVESRDAALDGASATYFLGQKQPRPVSDEEVLAAYRGGVPSSRLASNPWPADSGRPRSAGHSGG